MSKDLTVVREITDLLMKGNGEHQIKEMISANELTADLFQRAELQFIKAAISVGSTNVNKKLFQKLIHKIIPPIGD